MKKHFTFGNKVECKGDRRLNNDTLKKLWKNFCFTACELSVSRGEELSFVIGSAQPLEVRPESEYAISVNEQGAAVSGRDFGGLMRGIMVLMMQIEYASLEEGEECFKIGCMNLQSSYRIKNRMIHICVFPENSLNYIKKLVRLIAVCQYTHIVVEFWGTLRYDCLKELSWPNAFTKGELREIIREIRELGMEPIPMFNMLGHASASRICFGKHVVLDQNPRLQPLFTPDGWVWNITSPKVKALLREIRKELYDLFGESEYFHIGCDEAYYAAHSKKIADILPAYLGEITHEVAAEGRRPMVWMDMFLEKGQFPKEYFCNGAPGESEKLISRLEKETVMVDWQYNIKQAPIETLVHLKNKGFELIGAPWLDFENISACIDTVSEHKLSGVMLTLWHTLKYQMRGILRCAHEFGAQTFPWSEESGGPDAPAPETASLLRRLSFEGNSYEECGWSQQQIDV